METLSPSSEYHLIEVSKLLYQWIQKIIIPQMEIVSVPDFHCVSNGWSAIEYTTWLMITQ